LHDSDHSPSGRTLAPKYVGRHQRLPALSPISQRASTQYSRNYHRRVELRRSNRALGRQRADIARQPRACCIATSHYVGTRVALRDIADCRSPCRRESGLGTIAPSTPWPTTSSIVFTYFSNRLQLTLSSPLIKPLVVNPDCEDTHDIPFRMIAGMRALRHGLDASGIEASLCQIGGLSACGSRRRGRLESRRMVVAGLGVTDPNSRQLRVQGRPRRS
jgi:hypothetical protein